MKVGIRIILSFVVLGVFIIIASFLGVRPIENKLKEIGGFHSAALFSIQSLNSKLTGAVEESFAFVVSGDAHEKEEFFEWAEHFHQNAKEFYHLARLDRPGEEDEKSLYDKIVSGQSVLVKHAKSMFEEYGDTGVVSSKTFQQYEQAIDLVTTALDKFVDIEREEVEYSNQIALQTIQQSQETIYGVALMSLILAVGLGVFVSRTISRPLLELQQAAANIGRGNFSTEIEITSQDEIGSLAHSFNKMANDLLKTTVTKDYFDNIIRNITNYLVVLSPEGKIKSVNQATLNLLGYEEEELLDQSINRIVAGDVVGTIRKGEIRNEEKIFHTKEGRKVPVIFSASIFCDMSNKSQGIITVAQDITNQKINEEENINSKNEAESARMEADRANRAKSVFLANMSHEIRTPMNAIIGMGDLLTETNLTAEQEQLVNISRGAGENLLLLINDILDLSKIEAGQIELESIEFNPRQLLEKTIEILGLRAEEKGLLLNFHISPDVPSCLRGDVHRLRQVLTNLIGNAIKFTEQGEVLVHVKKDQGTSEAGGLYFSVSDTGIGIPLQNLNNIFNSFSQADSSITRKYGGSGLGLGITKKLVELMQGQIWVKSQVGKGSSFYFTVRFDAQAPSGKEQLAIPEKLKKLKTLVVDHRPSVRSMITDHLLDWEVWAIDVDSANMAYEVIQRSRINNEPYQLLLINSRLPGIGGFRLVEKIRNELDVQIPTVMMMPIDTRKGDLEQCNRMGMVDYVAKFINPRDLLEKMTSALDQKEPPMKEEKVLNEPVVPKEDALRILLVEDSDDNRLLIQLYLKKSPHEVDIAENGEEALQKFDPDSYDLILMDMQMPVMDGYTATQKIREMEKTNNLHETPIIALTAHALKGDREKCLDAGCTDYVAKPVKKDQLLELLQNYQRELSNGNGNEI